MNDYNGLREGLHGGSELVQLNGLVTVSTSHLCIALLDSAFWDALDTLLPRSTSCLALMYSTACRPICSNFRVLHMHETC